MQFIFWQNIISIHQSAFLSALAENYQVTIVVEREIEENRKGHGWNIPSMGKSCIIIAPSNEQLRQLIKNNIDSIHIFSGIHAFQMVSKAFLFSRSLRVKTLVYLEPYQFWGATGLLRRLKYTFIFARHGSTIDGILPTGELGCKCYRKVGVSTKKIFQWGYFTEYLENLSFSKSNSLAPSILFVGSIDERKNILYLVNTCKKISFLFNHFTIIGTGRLSNKLKHSIKDIKNIYYLGGVSNAEVKTLMHEHDILVLPSVFDGWGAVVNEALQNGMRVIASENCGSSVLLDGKQRGEIFYFKNGDDLETVLKRWLIKGPQTVEERQVITQWTKKTISGEIVSEYFVQICKYTYGGIKSYPIAPWLKNEI